ncbi:DUF2207 domain-containing protein [Oceanobacillus kimchii]|uniref:DUF2207 domain-containing protein n=1 Tax=Oceanobacillus kimchii TaxID=746691 RepID=UPI0021A37A24|nr:DUF2207 domain-containing protein [Oceanobacillus kimchii]MCT1576763.1 DUF2207 domain-containing protein [Oceanobacillus kimchii]MCT2134833.1 DUF2207 domain-containing protein [Oceanobacillus kimchii]
MKKYFIIMMLSMVFIITGCSDDHSFTIDEVQIDAQIQEDGTITVQELYTYTFEGAYEGTTRSIHSDAKDFEAFLTTSDDPTISTEGLEKLTTEEEDDMWKIYTESNNETKKVLYSYDVHGSITKYEDVAELTYSFFDSDNETDLDNVSISIHTPHQKDENIHFFLHDDASGQLSTIDSGIQYTNSTLPAGKDSEIRLLFPSEQLSGKDIDKHKEMELAILQTEEELENRIQHLDAATSVITPMIWGGIGVVLLAGTYLFFVHPNRYRGNKGSDYLIRVFEETDPLMNSFLKKGSLMPESFIAALFSLKQRGIITMSRVPSERTEEEYTYRFSWGNSGSHINESDQYLKKWLFANSDEKGAYFLLESIQEDKDLSDKEKEKQAEIFHNKFQQWKEIVMEQDRFQNLRRPFAGYTVLSILSTIAVSALCYYLLTIQPISQMEQWILTIILGVITILCIWFRRQKWILGVLYFYLLIFPTLFFTINTGTIVSLVFYGITGLVVLITPASYWIKDIRKRKYAVRHAYHLFATNRYPTSSEPDKLEQRLEYAIVIGAEDKFAKTCKDLNLSEDLKSAFPLLYYPSATVNTFNTNYMMINPAVYGSSSSSSNTTSSTGGGGAGAF